jgi:hypothetical protein
MIEIAKHRQTALNAGPVCRPGLAWKRPGPPTAWVPVLERHPEPLGLAGHGDTLPGHVWLDAPGKVLHVSASQLEFREEPP